MTGIVLVIAIAILVLAQGGFFSLVTCACGVIVCLVAGIAWLRKGQRQNGVPIVALLFAGVAVSYIISALVNGASLTTLAESGVWASCSGAAFLSAGQSPERRALWLRVLVWFGIVTAVAGMFTCAGILQLQDGMLNTRLQLTFQYANAAGAWFGVITLLCLFSSDKLQRMFAAIPAAAMLLTESGGTMIVFAVAVVVMTVLFIRAGKWEDLLNALVQGVIAIALFVTVHVTMSPLSLVCVVVAGLVCWLYGKYNEQILARVNVRMVSIALVAIVVVCAVALLAMMSDRAAAAVADFGERVDNMRDGLLLWSMQPVFGVGPDNWQYLYQYIQTAPYYSSIVHCSYIQIMLDAGIFGIAFFVAACVMGMRQLVRQRKDAAAREGWVIAELAAMAFLLVHAALDFDLLFASLAFVLAASLSAPEGSSISVNSEKSPKSFIAGLLCLVLCLPTSVLGFVCASTSTALELANASGDYLTCEQMFEANPLAQADADAQSQYMAAFYAQGRYDVVADMYPRMMAPTDRDTLYAALAFYSMKDQARATAVLIDRMEKCPYDSAFVSSALQLARTYGVDPNQAEQFTQSVENVQALVG